MKENTTAVITPAALLEQIRQKRVEAQKKLIDELVAALCEQKLADATNFEVTQSELEEIFVIIPLQMKELMGEVIEEYEQQGWYFSEVISTSDMCSTMRKTRMYYSLLK